MQGYAKRIYGSLFFMEYALHFSNWLLTRHPALSLHRTALMSQVELGFQLRFQPDRCHWQWPASLPSFHHYKYGGCLLFSLFLQSPVLVLCKHSLESTLWSSLKPHLPSTSLVRWYLQRFWCNRSAKTLVKQICKDSNVTQSGTVSSFSSKPFTFDET